jgi:hypothetical protein
LPVIASHGRYYLSVVELYKYTVASRQVRIAVIENGKENPTRTYVPDGVVLHHVTRGWANCPNLERVVNAHEYLARFYATHGSNED